MPEQVIAPRIRGFLCLNAHPEGCAANVRAQAALAAAKGPGSGLGNVLVIGSSTGYGLASLLTVQHGYGADVLSICYERPPEDRKTASAGWYNLAEAHTLAAAKGRRLETINGDAFSDPVREQALAILKERFGKLDAIIYSLASPRRTDPRTGQTHSSVLKPLGAPFTGKSVDLGKDEIIAASFEQATEQERADTVKVMGGEDWQLWIEALAAADLLAPGCRTVAYSYIGPVITQAIYRTGTIGAAKEHLEATAKQLDASLKAHCGGQAWVSVNKALVTQASAAIPVVPLYIGILFKIMKAAGTHEGCIEQIIRLFSDHIGPGQQPTLDEQGRIRLDDWELDPAIQAKVATLWDTISTDTLRSDADYDGFQLAFRQLFGFDVPGVDYDAPTEILRPLV
jgi:enoyl-[acyl-carrier protein] reductase/trans-2-enoyl-CoA reductase (NAD+)